MLSKCIGSVFSAFPEVALRSQIVTSNLSLVAEYLLEQRYRANYLQTWTLESLDVSKPLLGVPLSIYDSRLTIYHPTVKLYVGITDYDWFKLHASKEFVEEVNFWRPSLPGIPGPSMGRAVSLQASL